MFTKLFVGALPFVYSNEELKALFSPIGTVVTAVMVHDPDRGRTRGFGFVEMSTPEEAQGAIEKLNGLKVGEKAIFVTEARERKGPPPGKSPDPDFKRTLNRKVSRQYRDNQAPGAEPGVSPDRPSWPPPRREGGFGGPPRGDAPRRPFGRPPQRGEPRRSFGGPGERKPFGRPGEAPRRPFGRPGERPSSGRPGEPRRPFGRPGERPSPGGFGAAPRTGFSRPSKWEPRGDDKRSFSPPRESRGDFGPGNRSSRPFGKPPRRSDGPPSSGKPPKKEFWKKFDKKPPKTP